MLSEGNLSICSLAYSSACFERCLTLDGARNFRFPPRCLFKNAADLTSVCFWHYMCTNRDFCRAMKDKSLPPDDTLSRRPSRTPWPHRVFRCALWPLRPNSDYNLWLLQPAAVSVTSPRINTLRRPELSDSEALEHAHKQAGRQANMR